MGSQPTYLLTPTHIPMSVTMWKAQVALKSFLPLSLCGVGDVLSSSSYVLHMCLSGYCLGHVDLTGKKRNMGKKGREPRRLTMSSGIPLRKLWNNSLTVQGKKVMK